MTATKRVAFATDDGTSINRHFGRLRGFLVVTVSADARLESELIPRPAAADQAGEHRHDHGALLAPIADCETLIAGGMGLPMTSHVEHAGLDLILTSRRSIDEALEHYLAGTLEHEPGLAHPPATDSTKGRHGRPLGDRFRFYP